LAIQPEVRKNEVLSFLRGNVAESPELAYSAKGTPYVPGALKDLSISRTSFKWGIPVPGNEKHVIYVWLDALANYMTAIGYGSDDPKEQQKFAQYWPADLHLVGKEIIRFHCVYWPAFLLAAGLPMPKEIHAHGWLLFEESKMSKSRGNIVRAETILDAFGSLLPAETSQKDKDLFGADVLRYFLLREIPFGSDGSFSFDALVQRYNSDLANGYGNLVSRTLKLIETNFDGVIPEANPGRLAGKDAGPVAISQMLLQYDFSTAITGIYGFIAVVDGMFSRKTPWKLAKETDDESRLQLAHILYEAADSIRMITAQLYPIMPYATAQVWAQLGLGDIEEATRRGELQNMQWGGLKPGTKLGALAPIFPRADKGLIEKMTEMEAANVPASTAQPVEAVAPESPKPVEAAPAAEPAKPESPQIVIDDFAKVELRVAKVLVAERIPKADKLLRLEVDLGYEKRQILSGIAEWYAPEELVGRRIIIVANLAPRKMRGLESHGMLLAASHGENGKPILATFADSDEIELGSRLK
ncbi:MAG: methionine--tRNA ligase subunit beta, partial [Acidobacteriaceae bacterium]|nr:methionine--tRNA ligase subunit beta [Acidobacteriaceae bacterium]